MYYIVNDIENVVLLQEIGVFSDNSACNSMSITNFRLCRLSPNLIGRLQPLFKKGLTEIEVDIDYYRWCHANKILLRGWGLGDKSTLYVAKLEKSIIISDNGKFHKVAKAFGIECIYTKDFAKLHTENAKALNFFMNYKMV